MNRFLKEIHEQPLALNDTLDYLKRAEGTEILNKISTLWHSGKYERILFTGMGSSYFAGYLATCVLSDSGIPSFVINAGELLHYHFGILSRKSLLVCISQSGESYEVVKILEKLPAEITSIGITNELNSTVAKNTSLVLFSKAGKEEMTSTKTYVSTLLVLNILCISITGKWKNTNSPAVDNTINLTEKLITEMPGKLKDIMDFLGQPPYVQLIGRGPAYASVMQGALMFREGARTAAAGTFGGEFRHGPMEMVTQGFVSIILGPDGPSYEQSVNLARDIIKFNGKVIFITNRNPGFEIPGLYLIDIPCNEEHLFPIPAIVPLQFMVNRWAESEGNEPGDFTRGAKVTTTE